MTSLRQLDNTTRFCAATLLAFGMGAAVSLCSPGEPGIARLGLWTSLFLGAGLAASALLGLWLAAGVARPLQQASAFAQNMAKGQLDGKLTMDAGGPALPLQSALQQLNDRLQGVMAQLHTGADALVSGTGQIAAGSLDLSARTEQQASSLEETASSMEELTATVKQNADHAHQASKLATSASEVAVKGGAVVSEVVGTMASINESSKRIAEIIGVIDGIAFQTNILALNAAVEAARAGEQGRGFAVVASEVRSLAQRSAAAAKEIKELIDDSVEKVDAGTQLADKAGNTMNEVVASVQRVTAIIAEIADASAEQTTGIDQVNHAIADMDQATQHNAALVEQSAAAAAAMREQAETLTRLVGAFGAGVVAAMPAAAPQPAERRSAKLPVATARPRPGKPGAASQALVRTTAPRRSRAGNHSTAAAPATDWEEF
jgi:methyl-accepting chemotaxis protein